MQKIKKCVMIYVFVLITILCTTDFASASIKKSISLRSGGTPTAILYSNGELVFQLGSATDSSKGSVVATYTGFDTSYYTYSVLDSQHTPWYSQKDQIKVVTIKDRISVNCTSYYFEDCTNLTTVNNIGNLYITQVTTPDLWDEQSTECMFYKCESLKTIDMSGFNTSNVTDMSNMFYGCKSLTSLNVSNFNTSKVTNMADMFYGCESLTSLNVSNFNTSKVTDMAGMFSSCDSLTTLNVSNFNTSNVTDMSNMFFSCDKLTSLDLSNFNTSKVTNMADMFWSCKSLTTLNVSNFDTSNVTTFNGGLWAGMFSYCESLTSLDLSNFNTSKITNMKYMFYGCSSLTSLNVSNFDTSNVTNMENMFHGCKSLTSLNVTNFNTSKVTNMAGMFEDCSSLTSLNVRNFNTSNVTNMGDADFLCGGGMFENCKSLTSLDISNFDTSNVTSMMGMFYGCSSLTSIDVSNFNTSKVTSMSTNGLLSSFGMFGNCSSLTSLDISNFDTSNVKDDAMVYMIAGCDKLEYITIGKNTVLKKLSLSSAMFTADYCWQAQSNKKIYTNTEIYDLTKSAHNKETYRKMIKSTFVLNNDEDDKIVYSYMKNSFKYGTTITNPTKAGYTFDGWQYGTQSKLQDGDTLTNTTYTAQWIESKFKNKYEHWAWGFKNEGNNSNKTAFLLQTTYGEENYGEEFAPDASYALTVPNGFYLAQRFSNNQITGKWTTFNFGTKITQPSYVMNFEYDYFPTDYTITYNLNGGTNNSSNPSTYNVLYGVTFSNPTKTGYDFLGWYDANGNKITGINEGCNATFSDTADLYSKLKTRKTGNVSITAKWTPINYTISYNLNGGTANNKTSYTIETEKFTLNAPTKKGYTFVGWTGSNGTTAQTSVSIAKGSTGNKSYTANWTPINYTITYNLDGGTASNKTSYNVETATFTLSNPTKNGYVFAGWTGSNGTTKQTSVSITKGSTGNKSYTANWTPINYTIKYDANGGSGTMADSTIAFNSGGTVRKNTFTKTGYTFDVWYMSRVNNGKTEWFYGNTNNSWISATSWYEKGKNPTGTSLFRLTDQHTFEASNYINNCVITAHAQWKKVTYTISYTLNGGSISGQKTTYDVETATFTLPQPTKKGYTFVGWTGSNGTTPQKTVSIAKGSTGNKSYTAVFEKTIYTITTSKVGSGALSDISKVEYDDGTSVFITPAEGYTTSSLKIDGVSVSPVSKYNFLNVNKNHKVEATFTISQNRKMELMQKSYKWIDLKL